MGGGRRGKQSSLTLEEEANTNQIDENDLDGKSSGQYIPAFASCVPKFNGKNFDDFSFGFRHALILHELDSTLEVL